MTSTNSDNTESNTVNRRSLSRTQYTLPDYVFPENISKRHQILSNFPLSQELIVVFNLICDFIRLENDELPLINLKNLYSFIDNKKVLRNNNAYSVIRQLINLMDDEEIQLVEVVNYETKGTATVPTTIVLKEYKDLDFRTITILQKHLDYIYTNINQRKFSFPDLTQVSQDLKVDIETIIALCSELSIETLTLKQLLNSSYSKNVAVIIKLPDELREIIVPSSILSKFVYLLISIIKNFYESDENRQINQEIEKRLKEQSLQPENINHVLSYAMIQDVTFLNFSQIFHRVMVDLSDRYKSTHIKDGAIKNNVIASIILSKLSFNRRKELYRQEQIEKERKSHFACILPQLLNNRTDTEYSKNILYPSNLEDIKAIKITASVYIAKSEKPPSTTETTLGEMYGEQEILEYIKETNDNNHVIKNIIVFNDSNKFWYVHRCRLISTFFALLENERRHIIHKLKKRWSQNIDLIPKNHETEVLDMLIEEEASSFFLTFYKIVAQTHILEVPETLAINRHRYLLYRMFFNEAESIQLKTVVSADLIITDDTQKKTILKLSYETIFNQRNQLTAAHELLQIFIPEIKREVIQMTDPHILKKVAIVINDLLNAFINFLRFSRKRLPQKNQLNKKKDISAITKKVSSAFKTPFSSTNSKKLEKEVTNEPNTQELKKNQVQKEINHLKEKVPLLNNIQDLQTKLSEFIEDWNFKVGDARKKQTEYVNDLAEQIALSISIDRFDENQIDAFFEIVFRNNPKLKNITNKVGQKSFEKYLFYLSALYRYQSLTK